MIKVEHSPSIFTTQEPSHFVLQKGILYIQKMPQDHQIQ